MSNTVTVTSIQLGSSYLVAGGTTLVPVSQTFNQTQSLSYSYGTGVAQMNSVYWALSTLAASGTLTLDMTNTSSALLDPLGGVLPGMARIKWIEFWFYNATGYTSSGLTIGGGSQPFTGAYSGTFPLRTGYPNASGVCAQARFLCSDATGWAITHGTNSNILITNNDSVNAAQYQVWIGGSTI